MKSSRMRFGVWLLVSLMCGSCLFGKVVVKDVSWQQRWPWNGLIDITYSVETDARNYDGTAAEVTIHVSGYDLDLDKEVEMKTISGDGADHPVKGGGPYTVTWDAKKDHPNLHSSAFKIKAWATTVPKVPNLEEEYVVIDLSAGPTAAFFPHRVSQTGPDITQDACRTTELWLRKIPAGTFMMGSPKGEVGRSTYANEPLHEVTLSKSFYIGIFEVTQGQWERITGENPSWDKGMDRPVDHVSYDKLRGADAQGGGGWPSQGHKVESGSFLGILRAKTGLEFDLPTEAQWEYACRAGTTTALNSGKNLTVADGKCPNMDEVGRYGGNASDGRGGYADGSTRVGSYLPNLWGLYDFHGNVSEWCLDWDDFLGSAAVIDPVGASSGSYRECRGGHNRSNAKDCRSAVRASNGPAINMTTMGCRLVIP